MNRTTETVEPLPRVCLLPVGGGKGGVGKTFLVANLAASLARRGYRVVAVDADIEGANLHTCLGVPRPQTSLAEFVAQREEDLRKLLIPTPIRNVELIAATNGNLATPQPSQSRRVRLTRGLRELDTDFVLLDLGAGTHPSVMDYFMVAEDGIVVVSPEPTSVENAYAFIRASFYRRLRLSMVSHGVRKLVNLAMDQRNERGIRTPVDLLREIEALDANEGGRFVETMRAYRPRIVINEARTADDIKLGFAIRSVCRKYFGIDCEYLGYVNHDDAVRQSVRDRRPVIVSNPRTDAAIYVDRITRKLASTARNAQAPAPRVSRRR